MATTRVDARQYWHKLALALDDVGAGDSGVDAGIVNDGRVEGREEGDGTLEFLFPIREEGPVGAVAPVSNEGRESDSQS